MHRASTRQADLDARILRERRIGRRLLGAPETYTALAERPGRALLGGAVASLVVAVVVAVVAAAGAAGAARTARQVGVPSTATPTPPVTAGGVVAGRGALPVVVSVSPEAAACRAGEAGIEVVPLFTGDGLLGRVELDGFAPGCVGRDVRLSLVGVDGGELASRVFVLQGGGPRSVSFRDARPLPREALGQVVLAVL
jgi:hypothetical protein